MGGEEWPRASIFAPVTMYSVYKTWEEMYHKNMLCEACICEADVFISKIEGREKDPLVRFFL